MGRIGEAITCIEEYERDYTDIDDFKIRVDASYARGCLALSEGDIEEAERHFNTALDIAHKNNSVGNAALSLQSIGMIRLKQGNTGEAEDYLRRSCEALNESEYARPYLPDALLEGMNHQHWIHQRSL